MQSLSEPLSVPIPCYQGLIQGFFTGFAEGTLHYPLYPPESKSFLAPSFHISLRQNREFNF